MIRTRVSRPFGRPTVPLTERDAVRSLGALVGEAINKRYEAGWSIRARTCDGRIGLNMIDGSGCGGGLGTDKCGDDSTQTGTSGAGDVFWAQRTEGRTVRLNYDLGPAATFAGATTSSRGIASNRALPVSGSPTITTFSYEDGILTWDTSGGNVFLTVLGTGVTTSLEASGTMQALAGTTYTLTVRNQNGIFVTGTVIVPSQADGLVIVDSVGNVFALTPNGPLWDATWCGTAAFFGATVPTHVETAHIEHVPEQETYPDSYRGVLGSQWDYFLGDAYNIAPVCDWADVSAQGLPINMPLTDEYEGGWPISAGSLSIGSGEVTLVYHESASTGYEGTSVEGVVALATLDSANWKYYNPDFTTFSLGSRLGVVVWGETPFVGLASVLTTGGTTASLRLLEPGPETAMVGPTWAVEQTVTIPDIGSWGVTRVEPTWWRGGSIVANQLFYYY